MIRVVVTGSESTGKTTLASRLVNHYAAGFVPEFVRTYAARHPRTIGVDDHGPIARGQIASEDAAMAERQAILIQDTDLLSTVVYATHYAGSCSAWIAEAAAERRPDLYLLCEIDIPWVADDVRDRGHMREEMQALFRDALAATETPVVVITGEGEERIQRAVDAVDALRLTHRED